MKSDTPPKLSEMTQRIVLLVDLLGGGSQRGFAKIVGCSHAVIAKIVKGQQEPGKAILLRIGQAPQVNQDWLLTGEGEALVPQIQEEDRRVPVAECLLPGLPSDHLRLLSSKFELIPASLYRDSIYAVDVASCVPAYDDPEEHFLPGDLILIDADPTRWMRNLQSLQNRLCVTMSPGSENEVITMRRVQVSYSQEQQTWSVSTCLDPKMAEWLRSKEKIRHELTEHGKHARFIDLRSPSEIAASKPFFQEIPASMIVGKAMRLLRDL